MAASILWLCSATVVCAWQGSIPQTYQALPSGRSWRTAMSRSPRACCRPDPDDIVLFNVAERMPTSRQ
eukprot:653872-Hanusia_phi.AAC.1